MPDQSALVFADSADGGVAGCGGVDADRMCSLHDPISGTPRFLVDQLESASFFQTLQLVVHILC